MTNEASPRPWRLDGDTIRDANGCVVVSALNPCGRETRRLIVEAVNEYSPIPKTEMLADAVSDNIALVDERDRLRDIVRRFCDIFTPGTIHPDGTMERLLREARAAIGGEKQ